MTYNYNSQKDHLMIREYGRNIQNLIKHAISIEDREERNAFARAIINLMAQLNPGFSNIEEYKRKLWDHIYYISEGKLDVDYPYGTPEFTVTKTMKSGKPMKYPTNDVKFRHYGKNVETMIRKAIEMEDPDKRKAFTEVIGNYMKLVYNNWNRENVTDEMIVNDIRFLSGGELSLGTDSNLDALRQSNRKKKKPISYKTNTGKRSSRRVTRRRNGRN